MARDDLDVVEAFLDENNINAYAVLGINGNATEKEIKQAYRGKAKLLHPDKSKSQEADLEFVILSACYEYAIAMAALLPSERQHHVRRNNTNHGFGGGRGSCSSSSNVNTTYNPTTYHHSSQGTTTPPRNGIDHSLFTGEARRQVLDDDLDVAGLTEQLKNRCTVSPSSYQNTEPIFNVFEEKEDFDPKKFNALFEYLKDKHDTEYGDGAMTSANQIVGFDLASGSMGTVATSSVSTYNGLFFTEKGTQADYSTPSGSNVNAADVRKTMGASMPAPQKKIDELLSEEDLQFLVEKREKDLKKLTKKEIQKRIQKHKEEPLPKIEPGLTYAEAERRFVEQKMRDMRMEMNRNRNISRRYAHLYPSHVLQAAEQGRLDDSSTCLFTSHPSITAAPHAPPSPSNLADGMDGLEEGPGGSSSSSFHYQFGTPTGRRRA